MCRIDFAVTWIVLLALVPLGAEEPAVGESEDGLYDLDSGARVLAIFRVARTDPAAFDRLLPCLDASEEPVRVAAALAISTVHAPSTEAAARTVARMETALDRRHAASATALSRMGPSGITALTTWLDDPSPLVRASAARGLAQAGPAAAEAVPALLALLLLDSTSEPQAEATAAREEAGRALEAIRDVADAALLRVLLGGDPAHRSAACRALSQRGGRALPILLGAFTSADAAVRLDALTAMIGASRPDPDPGPYLPPLWAALHDSDGRVARVAAEELATGRWPLDLRRGMEDPDPLVRAYLTERLNLADPAPAEWVPRLRALARDTEPRVRRAAVMKLGALFATEEEAVDALGGATHDEESDVRFQAMRGLREAGPGAARVLTEVLVAIADPNRDVRLRAVDVLYWIGPAASEAVPALTSMLRSRDPEERDRALLTLSSIGPLAVPAVVAALAHEDPDTAARAAWALGRMGPAAADAVPQLLVLLRRKDSALPAAAEALRRIGPPPSSADSLVEALDCADPVVTQALRESLVGLGAGALPSVLPWLEASGVDPRLRTTLLGIVKSWGPSAADASRAATRLLGDPSEEVRYAAVGALAALGEAGFLALRVASEDPSSAVRQLGVEGLRCLPRTPAVISLLLKRLGDADGEVRLASMRVFAPPFQDTGLWHAPYRPWPVEDSPEVVAAYVARLHDADERMRSAAADGLSAIAAAEWLRGYEEWGVLAAPEASERARGTIGPHIPAIGAMLGDPDAGVRERAASILACCGEAKLPAMPSLLKALGDPSPRVVAAACGALYGELRSHPELAPSILPLLRSGEQAVRVGAMRALGSLDRDPGEVLDAMLDARESLTDARRWEVEDPIQLFLCSQRDKAAVIARLGVPGCEAATWVAVSWGAGAVPHLAAALRAQDPRARKEAMRALVELAQRFPEAWPPIVEAASSSEEPLRIAAYEALARGRKQVDVAVLKRGLEDPSPGIHERAIEVLCAASVPPPEVLPWLMRELASPFDARQLALVPVLGRFGPRAAWAVPWLLRLIETVHAEQKPGVARALMDIGADAEDLVPRLLVSLLDEEEWEWAAETLARLGPRADDAEPLLAALLDVGPPWNPDRLARAMQAIRPREPR